MVKFTFFSVRPGYEAGDWTLLINLMKTLHNPVHPVKTAMEMAVQLDRFVTEHTSVFNRWHIEYNDDDSISFYWIVDMVTNVHEDDPFFEIQFVEDQQPFFQLGNLPVYKLRVTRWEYSSEELNTGVDEIDAKEDVYSLSQLAFQVSLENESGSMLLEDDSVDNVTQYILLETYSLQTQSTYAANNDLDNEAGFDTASTADDILDFSEANPFGDPGDF